MATPQELDNLQHTVVPAQLAMHKWLVPASVTLAQWTAESAWGLSQLARRANNFFGIKAVQGQEYMEFSTREVVRGRSVMELADFARYPSPIESFDAHGKLLATLTRYQPAMRVRQDIAAFCAQLYIDGYSTEPEYADRLLTLIREHNLTRYDVTPQPDKPAAVAA